MVKLLMTIICKYSTYFFWLYYARIYNFWLLFYIYTYKVFFLFFSIHNKLIFSVKSSKVILWFTGSTLKGDFVLTLRCYILFIFERNKEIQMKILEYIVAQMQGPLHNIILDMWRFHSDFYFAYIWLCFSVIREWIFFGVEPLCAAGLILHTLKVLILILWNIHDESDMLILENPGLPTGTWHK